MVSVGAILGTLLRWFLSLTIDNSQLGTLSANVLGCALAAFLLVLMERHGNKELRLLLLPGFCGGLTTFSAVMFQSVGSNSGGALNVVTNVLACLAVVVITITVSRKIISVKL